MKMKEEKLRKLMKQLLDQGKMIITYENKDNPFITSALCHSELFFDDIFVIIRKCLVKNFDDIFNLMIQQMMSDSQYSKMMRYYVIEENVPFTNFPMFTIYDMEKNTYYEGDGEFEKFFDREEDAYKMLFQIIKGVELNENEYDFEYDFATM